MANDEQFKKSSTCHRIQPKQQQQTVLPPSVSSNYANFKLVAALKMSPSALRFSLLGLLQFQLTLLMILLTLTGFVCTNKAHPGEECLSNSNVLCFECDSRYDPNCADPFDFSPTATLDTSTMMSMMKNKPVNETVVQVTQSSDQQQQASFGRPGGVNATKRQQKQLPKAVVCHGCCVKITSRMPDGGVYVKRTCTSNLQINYFMVGLVCMKESGDRGKMCFCETDYCNGQTSIHHRYHLASISLVTSIALASVALIILQSKPIHCQEQIR